MISMRNYFSFYFVLMLISLHVQILAANDDSLRGTITKERAWWDTKFYSIQVKPDFENQSITGVCRIKYNIIKKPTQYMQIDLQSPMH